MPVRGLQRLIRDNNAGRASVTSAKHFGPHLLLLPTSRRSVPVEAITEVEERMRPQQPSTGSAIENPQR